MTLCIIIIENMQKNFKSIKTLFSTNSKEYQSYLNHLKLIHVYVDQCVTLTPSSFVYPEKAPLVNGVEEINMEREDP